MNMLFYTAFVAIFAITNGKFVHPHQELEKQISTNELNDSPLCTVCEMVVQTAVDQLHDNATEAEIERLVKRVCKILPGIFETECDSLVDQYGEKLVNMLADSVNPHKICGLLKVCKIEAATSGMLVEPHREVEKQISTDVELNSPLCTVCELVMKEVESLIDGQSTKAEIEKVMEKVCDKLPGKVKKECNSIVDKYGDKIIDLLAEAVKPAVICTIVTLCL